MRDVIETVQQHARAIWHFRWHTLAATWFVCIAGWGYVAFMPDMYKASARVYVDTDSILGPLMRDMTVQTNVQSTVEVMRNAILSRPTLRKLSVKTGMADDLTDYEHERLIERLANQISITHDRGGTNLYWIEYMDDDPQTAELLVKTLLGGFVQSIQGSTKTDTTLAQKFLEEQIAEYELRLNEAETRLKEFKTKNVGLMPQDGVDYYQRLQSAMQKLNDVSLALLEAEQSLAAYTRQAKGEEPTFGFGSGEVENGETRAISARIETLENQLGDLLLRYTEQHPDVAQLQSTIAQLQQEKQRIVDELKAMGVTARAEDNPVYKQLSMAQKTKEAEVASLRVRKNEYQSRVTQLREMVDKIPAVEAELVRLNRDYDVVKKQFNSLLEKREAARLSSGVEKISDDLQYKVLDPPAVPKKPAWPNRLIFNTLVLIVGLGAGIGFGYLMTQFIPLFHKGRELEITGLPLLGVISLHLNEQRLQRRRTRMKQLIGAGSALFAVYFLVLIIG